MHPYLIAPPRLGRTGPKPKTVAERFWRHVDKTAECWRWTGPKIPHGYGYLSVGSNVDGTMAHVYAHRIAYEIASGEPIPDGMKVCHDCPEGDDTTCVRNDIPGWHEVEGILRPKFGHLWLGTQQENIIDSFNKDRGNRAHGETHVMAKLTTAEVAEIRQRWAENIALPPSARMRKTDFIRLYPAARGSIRNIIDGRSRNRG